MVNPKYINGMNEKLLLVKGKLLLIHQIESSTEEMELLVLIFFIENHYRKGMRSAHTIARAIIRSCIAL